MTGLNLVGLLLIIFGAIIAARAVMNSEKRANSFSSTRNDLRYALWAQSQAAYKGLWYVVAGIALQIVALIYSCLQNYPVG